MAPSGHRDTEEGEPLRAVGTYRSGCIHLAQDSPSFAAGHTRIPHQFPVSVVTSIEYGFNRGFRFGFLSVSASAKPWLPDLTVIKISPETTFRTKCSPGPALSSAKIRRACAPK
jgi:hypothetical protein